MQYILNLEAIAASICWLIVQVAVGIWQGKPWFEREREKKMIWGNHEENSLRAFSQPFRSFFLDIKNKANFYFRIKKKFYSKFFYFSYIIKILFFFIFTLIKSRKKNKVGER
jgi:hypothetical protein